MPFSDNAFTNSWLENTYADPIFDSIDFDHFDAAIGLSVPPLNQWGASYLQQPQPRLETSSSPTSECGAFFTSPVLPTTESISRTISFDKGLAVQNPMKRRSSSIDSEDTPFVAAQPESKRGRPCKKIARPHLSRRTASSAPSTASGQSTTNNPHSTSTSNNSNTPSRTPHHQVERKYRESLNTEMERLRLAVPSTARWEEGVHCQAGKIKPTKAMVLASAIYYIRSLEREMEGLRTRNAALSSCSTEDE
ncbi:putative transcription factor bhlh protein [Venturia nashicola]|uniref:Putative transcription factor bhlh protein n=1 Tax=Venturia nashicola TaxID=86259 RepID=A0A4Z1PUL8_9PEZI|nr:putative transcription factor bhlh protein [Venturia nashicola]TLD38895.1 putative transcription factor bhlh protein [Venturia nashicola]